MQALLIFFVMITALVLQNSYFPFSDIGLALLSALVVKYPPAETIVYSFFIGFFQDVLVGIGFVNTLVKTAISITASYFKNFVVLDEIKLCALLAAIFTPISIILSVMFTYLFQSPENIRFSLFYFVFSTLFNAAMAPAFYLILNRIFPNE